MQYYRTTIQIVVLSEGPFDCNDLQTIDKAITAGDCVGTVDTESSTLLTGKQAADALYAAGSEPGFFQLDADGNSIMDGDDS